MSEHPVAPDQPARDRIVEDLGSTLFVEAGAGSGKTSALVDRILALVGSGSVELQSLAAITFTERAAAELRYRLRRKLEERAEQTTEVEVADRYRLALEQLDAAAVGTLHAFAQRLLTEHPIEAGLPPRLEVLDEVSSAVAFDERWRVFLDELLADVSLGRPLLLLEACGVRVEDLPAVASVFEDNWDLVAERATDAGGSVPSVQPMVAPVFAEIRDICATQCLDPGDALRRRLNEVGDWATRTAAIADEVELLTALDREGDPKPPSFRARSLGRSGNYRCDVTELRQRLLAAGELIDEVRAQVAQACIVQLEARIKAFTLKAARERRQAGALEFHDLLVLARELLRDRRHGPAVRSRLHERYRRLLLDESQDTDPIQLELAVRIAAAEPEAEATGSAPWVDLEVSPGQLFFVGDPKQSIYRFRRADIAMFLAAKERFGDDIGGLVELTANFRTTEPVIEWVNAVFGRLLIPSAGSGLPVESQPSYVPLQAVRPEAPAGPPVTVLGREEHPKGTKADELREAEADEVARTISRILAEAWDVGDEAEPSGWRPARLDDITVVVPARTSLPFLEDALETMGIAYRAESSSLVYATRAVRDVLMVLRAVDDPTNTLDVVSALRTPLLGCGDDDLFRFKVERQGHWNYLGDQPTSVPEDDPVGRALGYLRALHDERHWLGPSELLDRIATDRRAFELGFAEGRPRDVWRRLRFVVDQARAWHEATGGNLRQYLHWVESQAVDGARVEEVILPETDDDAVRIMTVHAAKGLEFPITIVSGLSTRPQNNRTRVQVVFPAEGRIGYKVGKGLITAEFKEWAPIDEQMALDERLRLLYVACTRARDHLVVSLHRAARTNSVELGSMTNAELLVSGMGGMLDGLPDGPGDAEAVAVPAPPPPPALEPFEAWSTERTAALDDASRPTTVAATALSDEGVPDAGEEVREGLEKRPRDLDLPPWLKGRYGSAVGRAVHGVLQVVDLQDGGGIEAAVAAQCEAEAIVERASDVRRLVEAALGSPSVVEAAGCAHWRELYVCVPVGERLLEGYLDLLYRRQGAGLVVVDYKTASTADPGELDRRVEGYRRQGASYALAMAEATGEEVVEVVFVFLTPRGAIERRLPDLSAAVADVRGLIASGAELVVP